MKSPTNVPRGAQDDKKTALLEPQQNYGKDRYIIDLVGPEETCWIGTESGLLGAFHFDGVTRRKDQRTEQSHTPVEKIREQNSHTKCAEKRKV